MKLGFFDRHRLLHSLANEDTAVELAVLHQNSPHVLAVGRSGARVLPLLARAPRRLTILDSSQAQLWFIEMKLAAMARMDFDTYRTFMGYPPETLSGEERRAHFLELPLKGEGRDYLIELFERANWVAPITLGAWERNFARMSVMVRKALGDEVVSELFRCSSVEVQREFLARALPRERWNWLLRGLAGFELLSESFQSLRLPRMADGLTDSFRDRLQRALETVPASENFFVQLLFLGEVRDPRACPLEVAREVYDSARAHLGACKVRFVRSELLEHLEQTPEEYSFASVSDVPSGFSGATGRRWLQVMRGSLRNKGMVVARYNRHVPGPANTSGLANVTHRFADEVAREVTQLYDFDIFERIG